MHRLFFDANVLFSASYRATLRPIWSQAQFAPANLVLTAKQQQRYSPCRAPTQSTNPQSRHQPPRRNGSVHQGARPHPDRKSSGTKLPRVRQVDLMDRWIDLEPGTTKNDEPRKVRMTSEVFELMRACVRGKGPDDFVFSREDGRRVVDPRDDWYELCVDSALGRYVLVKQKDDKESKRYVDLNLHDFRRSAIRNMTRRGVSDKTAMRIPGHKTFSVFQRYIIVDEGDLIEASRLIERCQETDTNTDRSNFANLQVGAGEGNRTLTSSLGS
jgi:hypothetical protein